MASSQNGYSVFSTRKVTGSLPRLREWHIPGVPDRRYYLRDGSAGFLLIHFILWFHETIHKIDVGTFDEWGWAYRAIRGQTTGFSNHASGTAADVDATLHPLGKTGTFKPWQYVKIRTRLLLYSGCIRWGGDYVNRKDEMHFEINKPIGAVERKARKLSTTERGERILKANPGARDVIFS